MLKRQRPATPPIPSMPLLEEPSALDAAIMEREHKRRRTTPSTPSDSPWKFLNVPRPITCQANSSQEDVRASRLDNEYKATNNILRELHTLHQHRLLFSTPSAVPMHDSALQPKTDISPSLERSRRAENPYFETDPEQSLTLDEQTQVKERYEETNRLLGSAFLSRRRQLGLDGSYPQ